MDLHKNKEAFIDAIRAVSSSLKINESLIEKDYFVIFILSKLNEEIPGLLFKGGTCCSHAYNAIDRFSEDIDLSLDIEHFGRSHNIAANKKIIEVCKNVGFKLINEKEVIYHSHGSYNRYIVQYPISFKESIIKPYIQIEMSFYVKSYPNEIKSVNSIIGDWLFSNNKLYTIKKYNLNSFNICVQTLERTFIDKVFAICDYYERKDISRNSRHIYDLYMISKHINLHEKTFQELVISVRNERCKNNKNISAERNYNINKTLNEIIETNAFEDDYNNVTKQLLTKEIDYKTTLTILQVIIDTNCFRQ